MPRRRNRFAELEKQLRAAGGVAAAGSRLGNFADFKAGKRKITVSKKLTKEDKERFAYGLFPFNVGAAATPTKADRYQATVTRYSLAGAGDKGLSLADLGWDEADETNKIEADYYPALIIGFTPTAGAAIDPKVSDITGDKYRKVPGRSFSLPFGRTVAAVDAITGAATGTVNGSDEEDVRKHLALKLKATALGTKACSSVSYQPEVFRGKRSAIQAGPSTVSAPAT